MHMADSHFAVSAITLTPENWSGRILVRSALGGRVVNAGVARYRQLNARHLEPLRSGSVDEDGIYLLVQTRLWPF